MSAEQHQERVASTEQSVMSHMYEVGLRLVIMDRASRQYAEWQQTSSYVRSPATFSAGDSRSEQVMMALCLLDQQRTNPDYTIRFDDWGEEFVPIQNLYESIQPELQEVSRRALRIGEKIHVLDRVRTTLTGLHYSAYMDLLTNPVRDKKEHVQTAATLLAQFDTLGLFKKLARRYADERIKKDKTQGKTSEDKGDLVARSMVALFQLQHTDISDVHERQKFETAWGDEMGSTLLATYQRCEGILEEIRSKAQKKARHLNPMERAILAYRATWVLMEKNAPKSHKDTIHKAFKFTEEEKQHIKQALEITAPILGIATAFSFLGSAAIAHEFIPSVSTPMGKELIKWSYYANYALSIGASLIFRKALSDMGTAPNYFATYGFHVLKRLLPENASWQSWAVIAMALLPSWYDDPFAAATLLKGSSFVFTKNMLTSVFALSAGILGSWQLINFWRTGKLPHENAIPLPKPDFRALYARTRDTLSRKGKTTL